ncbi:TauD/TfdA family dioxygenase [Pigmentiphaga soli]|uniref:TauD/TfdA family dioxygenase n=1 Tax=Pigmentiphaga soli TaxID=1007095 RepID=A0ABP8GX60_9BURK
MSDIDVANRIRIDKITTHIGAEISGVDLSRPLDDDTFQAIHDALMENLVIFFRDQDMNPEQQRAFGSRFGRLHIHPGAPILHEDAEGRPQLGQLKHIPYAYGIEGHPGVLAIYADENSRRIAGEEWHSDVSCDAEPPMGSILRLTQVPPSGGDTLFSSMYAAYDALSEPMKDFLRGLTALHDGAAFGRNFENQAGKTYPCNEHPVVRTHPVTGRQALFVNRTFTTRIVQLDRHESDALLEMLFRHCEKPVFQCRFRWRRNSVAFWDNRCAMHNAMWDYYPNRRHGYRVTIQGDRPFFRE